MSTAELSVPVLHPINPPSLRRILSSVLSGDLAMDLGTANTLIYSKGRGILLNEPSVVAVDEESGEALAVGKAAKEMFGKTSRRVRCVRPMKDGVIADFDITSLMIRHFLKKVCGGWSLRRPRIVIGVPSGITQVEKRAVIDAAETCGLRSVYLAEEPTAAAIGAGLPIDKPVGNMIVDIGGGTTEVAILSMNGTYYSHSIRVAGDEMDEAIQRHIKRRFGLQIGIYEAERVKLLIGSALPFGKLRNVSVYGRDIASGHPRRIQVTDAIIREALLDPISALISSVATALEHTSPELAEDIVARGIHLAGGGALLKGLSERLHRETGIRFHRAADPLSCVVRGVGRIAENLRDMQVLCIA